MPSFGTLVQLLLFSVLSNRIKPINSTMENRGTRRATSVNLAVTDSGGGSAIKFHTACVIGFSIIRNGIQRTSPSTVGCAFIKPGSRKDRKEDISWEEECDTYGTYRWQQKKFIWHVGGAYNGVPKFVFFKAEDNATIPAEVHRNLSSHGFVYLAHSFYFENPADTKSVVKAGDLIFQPDYHFIENDGYSRVIEKLRRESKPYPSKQPIVFWRGSTTGISQTCRDLDRVKMCTLARNFDWLDLKITRNLQLCSGEELREVFSNRTEELVWSNHRGVLDIDGNVNAWGLFWRLGSGSVVFRVESSYVNAYILKMKPFVHYIPIKKDLSDLGLMTSLVKNDTFKHCSNSSSECKVIRMSDIRANALALTLDFSWRKEVKRVAREIAKPTRVVSLLHD